MSRTTLSFCYWACKNMAAAYWQWSSDDTINRLLAFSNSLLAAVRTLQCVCLQSTTQHKLHVHIIKHVRTVQTGNGNCVSSATTVEGSGYLNAVQLSGHYIYWNFNIQKLYVLATQCILCGSENKQRLFPYTALIGWFLWTRLNSLQPSGQYEYHMFNIHKHYILPTQCIYVFFVDLRTNRDYFPIKKKLTGFITEI